MGRLGERRYAAALGRTKLWERRDKLDAERKAVRNQLKGYNT